MLENENNDNMLKEENLYVLEEPNYIESVWSELWFKNYQVEIVLELTYEWATVPFIARYRKERTGNLDEEQIRAIIDLKDKTEKIYKAKQTAINWIVSLWKMTQELFENIKKAKTLKEVEEIYKPYKSKKKTKAMIAIEKWFQFVADIIKKNIDINYEDLKSIKWWQELLNNYSFEEIIEWTIHIISAEISANSDLRADLLETLQKYWVIISKIKTEKSLEKLNEKDKWQISKFDIYSDFSLKVPWLKPYQILALNRWEKLWILTIKIEKTEQTYQWLKKHYARLLSDIPTPIWLDEDKYYKVYLPFIDILEQAFKDWYDALFTSVENELRWILSEIWEDDAIITFKENLANLLMTKPEYWKKILAIDPWYRAGCKIAILDELWNPLLFDKIFLHNKIDAENKLLSIIKTQKPWVIVVWNGTWVNETIEIIQWITSIDIFIVNESWASVYSASDIAKEEFPNLDTLDRWTVSIWRRYIDPLSELVKVPVWSIWVWMYQHDVSEKKLEEKLWNVVEDVVNEVGINVNNASSYVLNYISGIDKRSAKKIYNNRPYRSRFHLKKQLTDKIYEQAVWFLRVPDSEEKLDNTDIHPEQYDLARYIMKNISLWEKNITEFFNKNRENLLNIYPDINVWTIEFIINSLNNAWIEKRINSTHKKASINWEKTEVNIWDIFEWVIRNVVAFWAFVDIGMKNDWLVHISQLTDWFVKDPKEIVEVWQTVKVKIVWIDEKTGKIKLSMRELN